MTRPEVGHELVALGREVRQREHAARQRVARRLVAGDEQQHEEREQVVGAETEAAVGERALLHAVVQRVLVERDLARVGRRQQHRDEVVLRVRAALLEQPDEVRDVLAPRLARRGLARVVGVGALAGHHRVRPVREALALVDREAEHLRDHDQRQRLGDVVDEVALAARRDVVDELARELADVVHQLGDARAGEPAADQAALPRVLGVVHRHDRQRVGAAALRPHALPAAEQLGLALDVRDVVVLRHDPDAVLLVAVHGIVLAHPAEDVVRDTPHVQRGVEGVGLERRGRGGHDSSTGRTVGP